MFGKLFHRNEVEPSASSTTSSREQGQALPAAAPQQSFSAAAAGPSFLANKTPRGVRISIANSRQASQHLQQQQEEEEQQQEGEGDSAEEEDEEPVVAAKPAKPASRPSFLQQIKAAAENPAEDQPVHVALSAPSAASMRKSAGKQQPERASAAAKPWKVDKQKQQQQQLQQQQIAQQQQQQVAQRQQSLVQQQQTQRQPSQSALGLRQAEMPQGGVEELQQQLMLEAKAREVRLASQLLHHAGLHYRVHVQCGRALRLPHHARPALLSSNMHYQ